MRFFILAVAMFTLLLVEDISANTDLSKLAGKQIYREFPVKNEIEYDESYQGNIYRLIYYNENIMQIKSIGFIGKNGEVFGEVVYTLGRNLWDDGNWKEWKQTEQTISYWNKIRDKGYAGTETCSFPEIQKQSSILYNSNHKLSQWDHVCINYNRTETWMECGQILMFYNIENESCYNHVIVRLCNKNNQNKYRRDIIAYQKVEWLEKTTKHAWQSEFYYPIYEEYISSVYSSTTWKETRIEWYVGQEVWDVIKGRGVVVNTAVEGTNKIKVKFETCTFQYFPNMDDYTIAGKYHDNQAQRLFPVEIKSVVYDLDKLFPKKKEKEKLIQDNNDTNHNCSYIYNQKYNLKEGDHVVWDGKCGHIIIFNIGKIDISEIAIVEYCAGKSSSHYCRATGEVEYIGANNLIKNNKCFKYP